MNFNKFAFFVSEIMLALISIILSSKIVFSVFSVESTDFHVVFFMFQIIILVTFTFGIFSILSRLNWLLQRAVDKF